MPAFIEIKNLTKKFGKKTVLNNINLEIPYGKIFGIIGENGSGKTTLLNTIIGYYKPTSGKVLFQSLDVMHDMQGIERRFGFATQNGAFYSKLTVEENLWYFGKLYGIEKKELKKRINSLLELVELDDARDVLAGNLSTGMQRRLEIACALIHKPTVLILDEPTEDLDPILRKEILALIRRINKSGVTIIITSHLLQDLEDLCDVIAVLHKGKILQVGTPEELIKSYGKKQILRLKIKSRNYQQFIKAMLKKGATIEDIDYEGNAVLLYTEKGEQLLNIALKTAKALKEKLEIVSLENIPLNIVFESLIRGERYV